MRSIFASLVLLVACGDDDGERVDAAMPDAPMPPAFEVLPPAEAALPEPLRAGTCPPGWTRTEIEGGEACAPFETFDRLPCAGASHRLPGDDECRSIGAACDRSERYATDLPDDALYVDRDAEEEGDGSRASPFRTLEAAVAAAPDGATLALSKGVHLAPDVITRSITLRGACVDETAIERRGGPATIHVTGTTELAIRDVHVRALGSIGLFGEPGTTLRVDRVLIDGGDPFAIAQSEGTLTVRNAIVRDTAAADEDSWGIACSNSDCTVEHTTIERSVGGGLLADSGAQLTAANVVLSDLRGEHGAGIGLFDGTVSLNAVVVDKTSGPSLVVSKSTVSGNHLWLNRGGSFCLNTDEGSLVVLERSRLSACTIASVFQVGGTLRLTDTLVRGGVAGVGGIGGSGFFIEDGALAVLERVRIDDVLTVGVGVSGGSRLEATDLSVVDVDASSNGSEGFGVNVVDSSSAELHRVEIVRATTLGLSFGSAYTDQGATGVVTDLRILETRPEPATGELGIGLTVASGSIVTVDRALIEEATTVAIDVRNTENLTDSLLDARDLVVRGTRPNEAGNFGRGIHVLNRSRATLERVRFESNYQLGMLAFANGQIVATDIAIVDVLTAECAATTCPEQGLGIGAASYQNGLIDMAFFEVRRARLCGMNVAIGGHLTLDTGRIAESETAICVELPEYDLGLFRAVVYEGNGVDFDLKTLPVPDIGWSE